MSNRFDLKRKTGFDGCFLKLSIFPEKRSLSAFFVNQWCGDYSDQFKADGGVRRHESEVIRSIVDISQSWPSLYRLNELYQLPKSV